MGSTLADDVVAFLKTGKKKPVALANCKYIFDFNRLQDLHLSLDDINVKYEMVNMPISIFKEYFKTIIIVLLLFIVLLSALIVSLYLLKRGKSCVWSCCIRARNCSLRSVTPSKLTL